MIQRIQSIFILLAMVAWNTLYFIPILGFTGQQGGGWELFPDSLRETASGSKTIPAIPMLILFGLITILNFLAFIAYKRRNLQLRITILTLLLQLFSYGMVLFYMVLANRQLDAEAFLEFGLVLPLAAAFLNFLAARAIRRDILLLKSLDRIRGRAKN
jgi:hypothetical protein